jgi:hypothetical protein
MDNLLLAGAVGSLLALYMMGAIIAFMRGHPSRAGILVLNLAFGWTVLGWFASIIWALSGRGADPAPLATKPARGKACPMCAETVQVAARVCRFCGHTFQAAG